MAARSRITVLLLLFLLSTEHSFAVTEDELTPLVDELLSKYGVNGMFSLAVSIPWNQNQNQNQNAQQIIQTVLRSDPADNVKNKINSRGEYLGIRVVAAKNLHAEFNVVKKLNQLYTSVEANPNDLLLFYVYASPCVEQCTHEFHSQSILRGLNEIRLWKNYAVVFSKVFKPSSGHENPKKKLVRALKVLATYKFKGDLGPIGLQNIFRCDSENNQMQCVSCSDDRGVADRCVSYDPPFANTNTRPQSVRGGSASQGGAQSGRGGSASQGGARANRNSGRGRGSNDRLGDRVRRDISYNTGDSSRLISESNQGAEDAPSVDEKGNDVATGEAASSTTGESVSLSPTGSDEGNGSDLRTAEDVSSPQIGSDSGDGNGKVSRGKGKVSKGKGGKGRRGKGGKGKTESEFNATSFANMIT
ncbi:uncharacterized protein si:dkey-96g2.1 [Limanda limanda]|uniref:uncharacterized protein si:dkey-96g2.1 n=1 Tax=Limanda limanda TaxID=27771 RepID=UPI0029C6C7BF|nr:uncharacterized protein si:dkey-96g2.1 [Limanda limanda]